jgi:N-acetylmuramic acid 6-phosphate etherase
MAEATSTVKGQLDLLANEEIVELMLRAEERVVPAVRAAAASISAAASLLAERLVAGGRLILVGAGTSGRLAVVEAAELPGTFGLSADRVVGVIAGSGQHSLAGTDYDEDDPESAAHEIAEIGVGQADVVVAVAASGRTPYTIAAAEAALGEGAAVVAVVNVVGSPLATLAHIAIEVPVGDEVLRGSTRLTAGTAQKVTLNALTTTAMTRAGRVHGDLMVDVVAANAKLRDRSAGIVAEIAECSVAEARDALEACWWNARAAVLYLVAGLTPAQAVEGAAAHRSLREALAGPRRHDAGRAHNRDR